MKILVLLAILLGYPAFSAAQDIAPHTRPAEDILYDDPTGTSTATITQVLSSAPAAPSNTTLNNVRRILIKQDVLIIQWGDTATTLLPRQFVAGIAVNRRAPRE
jgi:hypothetical protein